MVRISPKSRDNLWNVLRAVIVTKVAVAKPGMVIITKIVAVRAQKPARRGFCAFTLIETLVALMVGAIALISLYACFTQGFSVIGQSRENLRSTQIMLKQLERIRVCPFDELTNTTYNPQTLTDYFDPTDQPGGGGGTVYNVTFTPSVPASGILPDSYRTNMMLITVGISWTSGNLLHTNWMQTYAARNGIESYVATGQ